MQSFWDRRARENAYFFVDNRLAYRNPDLDWFWSEGERDLDRMFELLGVRIRATDTVLDIGCGVGRLTRPIAARAAHVYGLDISPEMLERARRHHADLDNVEWLLGDGASLRPLSDGSVTACVSHVVFQHIPDPRITLDYVAEMGRVLAPRGWAAFQVSNATGAHVRRRGVSVEVSRVKAMLGRTPRGQTDPAWLGSAVDLEQIEAVAGGSGLELECVVGEGTQFCLVLARRPPRGAGAP
jgi:SAM-dependent methyltransferase